jgi:hypothetical protein
LEYAAGLAADGLTVYREAADRFVPIPPMWTPEVVDDAALDAFAEDGRRILDAAVATARWTLGDPAMKARLYATFTPLEHAALRASALGTVATARVDGFACAAGLQVLELNATIPAMQGYSDLIAHRWLRTVARARGWDEARVERLVAQAGSNTEDLRLSLVAWYRRLGGRAASPAIAIVSRRGDSQTGELRHYERAFRAAGHEAIHAYVDEIGVDAEGRVTARGRRFDLLYRHVFARRVDPSSAFAGLLVDPGPNVVLNPVTSPLEVKGLLGLLHEAARDDALADRVGLGDEHRRAILGRIPWTRLLRPGRATGPTGEPLDDLPSWVASHPSELVIKRSWDYGGKGVVLGPEAEEPSGRARIAALFGSACASWSDAVARAASDPHAWVVQRYVVPPLRRHLTVGPDGELSWRDVYVDTNAFVNLGDARRSGGVARASASRIVNIASGGGLAPFVRRSVLEALVAS